MAGRLREPGSCSCCWSYRGWPGGGGARRWWHSWQPSRCSCGGRPRLRHRFVSPVADHTWQGRVVVAADERVLAGFVSRVLEGGSTVAPLAASPTWSAILAAAGSLVIAGASLTRAARLPAQSDTPCCLLFVGAILSSPLGWVYYLPLGYGPILGWMGASRGWDGLARMHRAARLGVSQASPCCTSRTRSGRVAAVGAGEARDRLERTSGACPVSLDPIDDVRPGDVAGRGDGAGDPSPRGTLPGAHRGAAGGGLRRRAGPSSTRRTIRTSI